MAHLDLEEQEQLDQLKHFWKQYGNLISWLLIIVLASYAGWNGWQYWQGKQATQAAALYDELERVAQAGDLAKLDRVLADMQEQFGSTIAAQQAALLAAKTYMGAGKREAAQAALSRVVDKASDEGYRAIARLRLAAVLADAQSYDEALKQLAVTFPVEFVALADDRRGDIYLAQGKQKEAAAEYLKAYRALTQDQDYRRLVDVKLAALGVHVETQSGTKP
jgi:predicted negative regulator of RcsB-dependent stress response